MPRFSPISCSLRLGNPSQRQVHSEYISECILGIVQMFWVCRFARPILCFLFGQISLRIFIAFIDYPRLIFKGGNAKQVVSRRTYRNSILLHKMLSTYSFTLPMLGVGVLIRTLAMSCSSPLCIHVPQLICFVKYYSPIM